MRRQYHFRNIGHHMCVLGVQCLVKLTNKFVAKKVALEDIQELKETSWLPYQYQTRQQIIEYFQMVQDADLYYLIILCVEGSSHG